MAVWHTPGVHAKLKAARVGVGQLIPRMEIEAVPENISDANVDVLVGRADI